MIKKEIIMEFLRQSNYIEGEARELALEDSWKAWIYAYEYDKPWSVNFILKVHKLLGKRIDPHIAGKFRHQDVWVGGHRKIFVSESLLKEELNNWLKEVRCGIDEDTELEKFCIFCHVMFERIHPFLDLNGRTGRILWQVQRLKLGLPVRIIYEDKKNEYYKWFKI